MPPSNEFEPLLRLAADRAMRYVADLPDRGVSPEASAVENLKAFDEPTPKTGAAPAQVIDQLDRFGSPATVASAGPRYLGFVIGGTYPVSVASNWIATAWDQNAGLAAMSPVAAKLEEVAARWLIEMLRLPQETGVGFVTGSTTAHMTALLAARRAILAKQGWDAEQKGLIGAPGIRVVATADVHSSVLKALGMIGLGREAVVPAAVDDQGRIVVSRLPGVDAATIFIAQAANVNSGSFDDISALADIAERHNAWLHVDAAFGAWARVSPKFAPYVEGMERADSMVASTHKMLNVPYDSAIVTCRDSTVMRGAMGITTSYSILSGGREPNHFTPEGSRRARGIDIWAVLKTIGSDGLAALVESCCANATMFADVLRRGGIELVAEVSYNQVLFSLGPVERRDRRLAAIQRDGTCWVGPAVWRGLPVCRASFCGWSTTLDDARISAEAILRVVKATN
jgi:glutamate/tyrosine decarboxylase-like PLP-dependent enzyme